MDDRQEHFIKIIQDLLHSSGRSVRWLAQQIGESPQKVHNWLTGKNRPRQESIWAEMESILRQSLTEEPKSSRGKTVSLYRTGTKFIPVYGGMTAGSPGSFEGDADFLEIKDWGSHHNRWGRVIQGYSMEPTILPGDIVVFEDCRPAPGHVVHAYSDEGEDTCKVWRGRELVPINPDYDRMPLDGGVKWVIKGVAVMIIRRIEHGGTMTLEYPSGLRHNLQ